MLSMCIQEVREWLRENFLLLNENKTEVVIFGKDTTEKQLQIGKSVISSIPSKHFSKICEQLFYILS